MASTITSPATADDRVSVRSVGARLLSRPEIGSLVGAAVILVFFLIAALTYGNGKLFGKEGASDVAR